MPNERRQLSVQEERLSQILCYPGVQPEIFIQRSNVPLLQVLVNAEA